MKPASFNDPGTVPFGWTKRRDSDLALGEDRADVRRVFLGVRISVSSAAFGGCEARVASRARTVRPYDTARPSSIHAHGVTAISMAWVRGS
jgi:hypothetical protein